MRKILLVLVISGLIGCSALKQAGQDAVNCSKDNTCLNDSKDKANLVRQIAGEFNPIAGSAAATVVLALSLWIGGRKKRGSK